MTLRKEILLRSQNYVFTKILFNTEHRIKKIYNFLMCLVNTLSFKHEIHFQFNKILRHSPPVLPCNPNLLISQVGILRGGNNKDEEEDGLCSQLAPNLSEKDPYRTGLCKPEVRATLNILEHKI